MRKFILEDEMENIYYSVLTTALLKKVFVASTEKGVCMVDFLTLEKDFLKRLKEGFPGKTIKDDRKNKNVLISTGKIPERPIEAFGLSAGFQRNSLPKESVV